VSTTTTRERPIIFTGESVRAILAGAKTQTRRVVKPQPITGNYAGPIATDWLDCNVEPEDQRYGFWSTGGTDWPCPYGGPGNRLWVREAWASDERGRVAYKASEDTWPTHSRVKDGTGWVSWKWRSPMFMPRCHSRLTLEITGVRVERVQDISEADAKAEGADAYPDDGDVPEFDSGGSGAYTPVCHHRNGFLQTWDAINGKRPGCAWRDNPWVWALTFKVVPAGSEAR
jgi:hypothetical protein